jgi:outer membrane protein assembly factor BamB
MNAGKTHKPSLFDLTAFDGATGKMKRSFQTPSYIGTPPAASNGIAIVGADKPQFYALNGATV